MKIQWRNNYMLPASDTIHREVDPLLCAQKWWNQRRAEVFTRLHLLETPVTPKLSRWIEIVCHNVDNVDWLFIERTNKVDKEPYSEEKCERNLINFPIIVPNNPIRTCMCTCNVAINSGYYFSEWSKSRMTQFQQNLKRGENLRWLILKRCYFY